jgi:putative peptide zinc metalloprotease protein
VQGHDSQTWKGRLLRLPESEAKEIPLALSNRANGPVAVKGGQKTQTLVPQTQHYLVYVDVENPDLSISPGSMAQVKVHCKPETVARWVWRKINALFDLGLM